MLTATDRTLLHACRAKRLRLTEEQRQTKKITRAPHPPGGLGDGGACSAAQAAEHATAGAITALHIIEAEIRGLTPANKAPSWGWLNFYRSDAGTASRERFDAWLVE